MRPGERQAIAFFFFNDTATTEIYTLSLHDALPISPHFRKKRAAGRSHPFAAASIGGGSGDAPTGGEPAEVVDAHRSEEHTSELQSHLNLVCRLLLEKKKS